MNSWLFTKTDQSVFVVREHGPALMIHGPGPSRARHHFPDEEKLQGFEISIAEHMADAGWILWGVDEQRRIRDRRAMPRGGRRHTDGSKPL